MAVEIKPDAEKKGTRREDLPRFVRAARPMSYVDPAQNITIGEEFGLRLEEYDLIHVQHIRDYVNPQNPDQVTESLFVYHFVRKDVTGKR